MTTTPATTPLATVADREGERRPVRREGVAAEPDPRDGGQAREGGQGNQGRQPRPLVDQGGDDADALGDVVEREAEYQEGAERGGAGGERRADREPLAEVVDADAERNRGREPHPLGPAAFA